MRKTAPLWLLISYLVFFCSAVAGCTSLVSELACASHENCPTGQFCTAGGTCAVGPAPADQGDGEDGGPAQDAAVDAGVLDAGAITNPPSADSGINNGDGLDAGGFDAAMPTESDAGTDVQDSGPLDAGAPEDAGTVLDAGVSQDAGTVPDASGPPDAGSDGNACDQDFVITDNDDYGVLEPCTVIGGDLRLESDNLSRLSPIDHVVRIVGDWEMIDTRLNRDDLDRMTALVSVGGAIRIQNNADLHVCKVEELAERMNPPVDVIDLGGNRNWNICDD